MIRDCPASVHLRGLRHRFCTSMRRRRNWSFDHRAQCVKELPRKGRPGFGFVRDRRRRVRRHRWSEWMREEHAFANAYGPRATNNRNHRDERESANDDSTRLRLSGTGVAAVADCLLEHRSASRTVAGCSARSAAASARSSDSGPPHDGRRGETSAATVGRHANASLDRSRAGDQPATPAAR